MKRKEKTTAQNYKSIVMFTVYGGNESEINLMG